ncbi:MAG: hypothetical protein V3V10_05915 [Planctomycetota bacterium]
MTEKTIHEKVADRQRDLAAAKLERSQLAALDLLLDSVEIQDGPNRVSFFEKVQCLTVGVGKDHTATIYMFKDDIAAVRRLLGQEEDNES